MPDAKETKDGKDGRRPYDSKDLLLLPGCGVSKDVGKGEASADDATAYCRPSRDVGHQHVIGESSCQKLRLVFEQNLSEGDYRMTTQNLLRLSEEVHLAIL